MRIILIGAVESTRITLETLVQEGYPPIALFTLPQTKAQRHSDYVDLEPLAVKYGVPVVTASNINAPEVLEQIHAFEPDYLFVFGWSQICRKELLDIPRIGTIGCHPAPLPENRGRGVIPWTILQRRTETALSLFWIDEGTDSGDILLQNKFPVAADETAATLYAKHCEVLRVLISKALHLMSTLNPPRVPQNHSLATYCAKRVATDGFIDWNLPAESIWTLIRAVGKPYPGAFTFYKDRKLYVWDVEYVGESCYWGLPGQIQAILDTGALIQCGDGKHILLKTVQFENEIEMAANLVLKNHEKLGIDILSLYTRLQEKGII